MARKRYALNINGDFETGTADWSISNGVLAQVNTPGTPGWAGTKSLQWTPASPAGAIGLGTSFIATAPGRSYTVTSSLYATAAVQCAHPRIQWYDSGGTLLSTTDVTYVALTANTWVTRTTSAVAPSGATQCHINLALGNTGAPATVPIVADEIWLNGTFDMTLGATATPVQGGGDWNVHFTMSTDALAAEYGAWRLWRGTTSVAFFVGKLPATYDSVQTADTNQTWRIQLYKDVRYPGAANPDWQPITTDTQGLRLVSTVAPDGASAIISSDGSQIAWVEIQSWPELRYTRRSATLQIMGSTNPVVNNDVAVMANSAPVLITRTTAARDQLIKVLSTSGPLHFVPYCTGLDEVWCMPLDFNSVRNANKVSNLIWLTECQIQHIKPPASTLAAAAVAQDIGQEEIPA
jgi:hypothetical protein